MNAIRADAASLATLLARGRIADALAPSERLARADFGAVGELPPALADHLGLYRRRAEVLRQAASRTDLDAARAAFDDLIQSCTACHREARPGQVTIELRIERP